MPAPNLSEINRAAFEKIIDIFSTGDLSQVDALIDPEYVGHQGLRGVNYQGPGRFSQGCVGRAQIIGYCAVWAAASKGSSAH